MTGAEIRRVLRISDRDTVAALCSARLPETLLSALLSELAVRRKGRRL